MATTPGSAVPAKPRRRYDLASIEKALTLHARARRIGSWRRVAGDVDSEPRHVEFAVITSAGTDLRLLGLREAYVFINGLASAAHAAAARAS